MQKSAARQLGSLVILVAVALLALLYFRSRDQAPKNGSALRAAITVDVVIRIDADTLLHQSLQTVGPLTALSALEQVAGVAKLPVGIRKYDFGRLVVSIGGHTAGPDGDWNYRVNDLLMPVAAEACQLKTGDRLVFRFGKAEGDTLAAPSN